MPNDSSSRRTEASSRPVRRAAPTLSQPPAVGTEIDEASLRQCLEALRMGVVPAHGLDLITVGRAAELASLRSLVERPGGGQGCPTGGMRVLCGGYGTGKSHLVEVAEGMARAANWLVCRASFDPLEVPPSHPVRLYRALAASVSYPDDTRRGLRPLCEKLSTSKAHVSPRGARFHRWLTPAAWACGALDSGKLVPGQPDDEQLVADIVAYAEGAPMWMEVFRSEMARLGYTAPLLQLTDYRTFGQLMAHLLGGIACWASDAGYGGLLVLLDEAEYLDSLGTTSRAMAENVLRYLAVGALPAPSLAFDPDTVYRGGHAVHRSIPTRFAAEQPLAVLCAFTPLVGIDTVLRQISASGDFVVPLEPLARSTLGELADRVYHLSRRLYPDLLAPEADLQQLRGALVRAWDQGKVETTRDAARLAVEFWDIYRRDPAAARRALSA